jgi:hypothetical protein
MCGPPSAAARPRPGWKREAPPSGPPQPEGDVPAGATWPGLAAAVAELTARIAGIPPGQTRTEVDQGSVIAALALIGAAALRGLLPDAGAGLLTDIGMAAARETAGMELPSTP